MRYVQDLDYPSASINSKFIEKVTLSICNLDKILVHTHRKWGGTILETGSTTPDRSTVIRFVLHSDATRYKAQYLGRPFFITTEDAMWPEVAVEPKK